MTFTKLLIENKDLLKDCIGLIFWICTISGVAIDRTPWIKLNPVKWCFQQLGRLINKEIYDKIDKMETKVEKNIYDADITRINDIRYRILDFSNSLSKRERDIEEYDFIYERHDEYERLLEKYGLKNGKVTRAMKNIDSSYNNVPR